MLAEAKRLKRAADAVTTPDAPKEMLRAVLQYLDAAVMLDSQARASENTAAEEQLAMLLMQTSGLCDFACLRAEALLRGEQSATATAALRLVRLLALRLCICCVAQAAALRRGALRVEAEAAAESAEPSAAAQKRCALALLDAIKLSELWERANTAASDAASSSSTESRAALSSCMVVANAAGGYGELRQIRGHAKHALRAIERLTE